MGSLRLFGFVAVGLVGLLLLPARAEASLCGGPENELGTAWPDEAALDVPANTRIWIHSELLTPPGSHWESICEQPLPTLRDAADVEIPMTISALGPWWLVYDPDVNLAPGTYTLRPQCHFPDTHVFTVSAPADDVPPPLPMNPVPGAPIVTHDCAGVDAKYPISVSTDAFDGPGLLLAGAPNSSVVDAVLAEPGSTEHSLRLIENECYLTYEFEFGQVNPVVFGSFDLAGNFAG